MQVVKVWRGVTLIHMVDLDLVRIEKVEKEHNIVSNQWTADRSMPFPYRLSKTPSSCAFILSRISSVIPN